MKKCCFSAFVFVLIVILFSCRPKQQEHEPNEKFDSATPISLNSPVYGTIESVEDVDIYVFEADKKGAVSIELTSLKGINHSILLYRDVDGKALILKKIDDSRKSSPEYFPALGIEPGRYYIKIAHGERDKPKGSTESKYRLTVLEKIYEEVEFEPNDSSKTATLLENGSSLFGFFSPSFDKLRTSVDDKYQEYDYFYFDVPLSKAGKVLANITVGAVAGVDSVVVVYGPGQILLNTSDSGEIGVAESIVGQGLVSAGRYYIKVYAKNYASNYEEPYTISLNIAEFDSSTEMERNNEIESANVIKEDTIKGQIYPENDQDFFVYTPSQNLPFIDIMLVPSQSVNARFSVYNKEKQLMFEVDNRETGLPEMLPALFTREEIFIKVEAFAGEIDSERSYNLKVTPNEIGELLEIEPNNSKELASYIEDDILYAYTSFEDDVDWYLIETGNKSNVTFKVTGAKDASITAAITDNLGYIINSFDIDGQNVEEFTELVNKRAYLIITTKTANYTIPYIIEVEK